MIFIILVWTMQYSFGYLAWLQGGLNDEIMMSLGLYERRRDEGNVKWEGEDCKGL